MPGSRQFESANFDHLGVAGGTMPISEGPCTIAGWVYADSDNVQHGLFWIGDSGAVGDYYSLILDGSGGGNNGLKGAIFKNATTFATANTTNNWARDGWHHVAMTVSGNDRTVTVILDGDLANKGASTAGAKTNPPMNDLALGYHADSSPVAPLNGKLAWFGVWNKILDDAQIQQLAAGVHPLRVRRDVMTALWPLLESGDAADVVGGLTLTRYANSTPFTSPGASIDGVGEGPPVEIWLPGQAC